MNFVLSGLYTLAQTGPSTAQQIGAIILIVLTFVIAYVFSRKKKT
ncbi:MAG: LPXTG cell wall anchor domain-containing protein [Candidatus Caldarchaeum sp.]|nr:LPXTG cell wall anchor domain-containing protein [Candidatus Caldarchaeum sp.]MDW8436263.1 LPXTG cell wall anchor domain-containing protein [Candidatus Caldarchaeum sp.]